MVGCGKGNESSSLWAQRDRDTDLFCDNGHITSPPALARGKRRAVG